VVFVDGKPKKSLYRRFRIRKTYTDPDDYAMMEEVISRKYLSKMLKDDPLPDLLVIDGGRGQLNIALAILEKLQLSIPAISIAKKNEEIFADWFEDPVALEQSSPVLRLIQHIRDESHRFAISYHRTLRRITVKETIFERIKGIGKAKVQILFHEYKTVNNIADANLDDIKKLLSVNEEIAKQVIEVAKQSVTKNPYANK
jgi:excinuclease ABC subunit C